MRTILRITAALLLFTIAAWGQGIKRDQKIYIEKMENDLDGYIRAEFTKQHVPLKIVLTLEEADIVMTGSATAEERRKWHEGWLTMERDKTAGNVSVIDPKAKTVLWSGEAGDRSFWWGALARGGHRKVASRIVKHLKKAMVL